MKSFKPLFGSSNGFWTVDKEFLWKEWVAFGSHTVYSIIPITVAINTTEWGIKK